MGNPIPVLRRRLRQVRCAAREQLLKARAQMTPGIDPLSPQVLGIGAARSATGWLHHHLSSHPELYLPANKEVHFFDTRSAAQLNEDLQWRIYWLQFVNGRKKIRADITPAYSILPEEKISIISKRMPNALIIYLIRDPVERAWSGLRHRLWHGKGIKATEVPDHVLVTYLQNEEMLTKGNYWDSIKRWQSYYPDEQIFCGLYDDVIFQPTDLIERLCAFIGVDAEPILNKGEFDGRVNAAPVSNIPDQVRNRLREYYQPQVNALKEHLGLNLDSWLS